MNIDKISIGDKAPKEFNTIIEIPANSGPIKYELDKDSGALFVDRFISTAFSYPCNYGFIPETLGSDGDPVDTLVFTEFSIVPGSVIKVRPIGVLIMEDEKGMDEKVLCVPVSKVTKVYDNIKTYQDLPKIKLDQIKHFFEKYKDLEEGKWVKVKDFEGSDKAESIIVEGIKKYIK